MENKRKDSRIIYEREWVLNEIRDVIIETLEELLEETNDNHIPHID